MYVTTRRRFEGIGENHGFSACREYHFSGHATKPSGCGAWTSAWWTKSFWTSTARRGCSIPFSTRSCFPSFCLPCPVWVRRVSRVRKSLGGESGQHLPSGSCCFSWTGGCCPCRCRLKRWRDCMSLPLERAMSACWWVVCGWAACWSTTSWTMYSTTRTRVSCRKHGS